MLTLKNIVIIFIQFIELSFVTIIKMVAVSFVSTSGENVENHERYSCPSTGKVQLKTEDLETVFKRAVYL